MSASPSTPILKRRFADIEDSKEVEEIVETPKKKKRNKKNQENRQVLICESWVVFQNILHEAEIACCNYPYDSYIKLYCLREN